MEFEKKTGDLNDIERIKTKVNFYHHNKIPCHIKLKPKGFINCFIVSKIEDDTFFWVKKIFSPDIKLEKKYRLFLVDVFDISDHETKSSEDMK